MSKWIVVGCLLVTGCAGQGSYGGAVGQGSAEDPRVAMLKEAAALQEQYKSQQTLELSWSVVELANGQQMLLPGVKTWQPVLPPDISMAILEASKDPWPGRIYAIGSGIVSAGMAATGVTAVHEIGKMGVAAVKAAPSVNNSTVINARSTGAGSASNSYAPISQSGDGSFNVPVEAPIGE